MSDERPTSEHPFLYLDHVLVRALAKSLMDTISAQGAEAPVALNDLPLPEQFRLQTSATIAVMRHNKSVVTAATFHAAKSLGQTRYGKDWDGLTTQQQKECYREAADVITAYELHTGRLLPVHVERQAIRIANEARVQTEAKRLANGT